ncbi:MAG: response regulator [Desulfobacterales bacterium]|nr:response regulator [Desulfobacterales bacterium]
MTENANEKILVIEDEADTEIFLSNLLISGGFHPIDAQDKAGGIQKAREETPGVIIIDMMMPGEEGIQLYRDLKLDEELKKIPVIMLSTIDKKTFFLLQKFQSPQSDRGIPTPEAYLEKPPEAEELLEIVSRLAKA